MASTEDFATLIRLSVRANNEENSVAGSIFGKYEPRLVRINKFRLEAVPEGHMLFIYNTDRPGVIGAIGSTIGKHSINIARMTVGQEKERGQNIILLTTDTPLTPEALKDVRPWSTWPRPSRWSCSRSPRKTSRRLVCQNPKTRVIPLRIGVFIN